jgi:crotonobetainyl-CoA:carnitine CoA-transferase CaiB-like acyl-CoA transferase
MKPLEGMRVLTLEQFGAGPYGTMFLADLGAEVIKIENGTVGGDPSRRVGPNLLGDNDSQYFQTWGSNKRSVTLDLKSDADQATWRRLVATADAVVNNLRGDQPEKLGLDYASLAPINPRLVCLHISAYGRDNGRKAWPGYDYLMQAEAGLMSLTGEPDGPPTRFGASMIDFMTGVTGVVGLLSCLLRARATGQGGDVDVSLFDVALHQLSYPGTWFLNGGAMPTRVPRSAHQSIAPVQTVRTRDGWIFVMCMLDKFWLALVERIGRADLAGDPRFASGRLRGENRDALTAELDAAMIAKTTDEWIDILSGVVPVGPVYDVKRALENPFVEETGMVHAVPHPLLPAMRLLANPLKIDGVRPDQTVCSPLGADNEAVLGKLTPKDGASR